MDRRRFLGAAAVTAAAGCLGDGTGATGEATTTATDDGGRSLSDHPAARGLADQPTRGPDPAEATGLIVAFEDPSCPTCRRFEQQVVPTIRSELVDPGDAAYVFRGYPVIYPWGEPAVRALEAAYEREPEAHWRLADHYFDRQTEFRRAGVAAVYDRTETFLAEETDLPAAEVVAEARNGRHDGAVETDLDAGMDAGAGRVTPHVFLFRDGQFRTKAAGSISFEIVESALGL